MQSIIWRNSRKFLSCFIFSLGLRIFIYIFCLRFLRKKKIYENLTVKLNMRMKNDSILDYPILVKRIVSQVFWPPGGQNKSNYSKYLFNSCSYTDYFVYAIRSWLIWKFLLYLGLFLRKELIFWSPGVQNSRMALKI